MAEDPSRSASVVCLLKFNVTKALVFDVEACNDMSQPDSLNRFAAAGQPIRKHSVSVCWSCPEPRLKRFGSFGVWRPYQASQSRIPSSTSRITNADVVGCLQLW